MASIALLVIVASLVALLVVNTLGIGSLHITFANRVINIGAMRIRSHNEKAMDESSVRQSSSFH